MAVKRDMEYYWAQANRIASHREAQAEKEIRKIYRSLSKELQAFVSDAYVKYAQDDVLTYAMLQKAAYDARFLEEIERKVGVGSNKAAKELRALVNDTYQITYDGLVKGVQKMELEGIDEAFAETIALTPYQVKKAISNPIMELALEKNRKDIMYEIKQAVTIGLMTGDRYTTMARRISTHLAGEKGAYAKAMCIARTEGHRAREAGSLDAALKTDKELQKGENGLRFVKKWKTMQDERVRPNYVRRGKKRIAKKAKNHVILNGQIVLIDEDFDLKDGNKAPAPGQSGVAGHDINCRCLAIKVLMDDEEFFAATGRHFPGYKGKEKQEEEPAETPELTRKEMREKIKEDRSLIGDAKSQMRAVDRDLDKHYITDFDDLKGLKRSDISGKIKAIEEREQEIKPTLTRLRNRPERGTPEYDEWREWRRNLEGRDTLIEEEMRLAVEKADLQAQLRKFDRYDEWTKWKNEHPLDALKAKRTSLEDEIKRLEAEIKDFEDRLAANPVLNIVDKLDDNGVVSREVKKHAKALTEDEIIAALSGGDMTSGSCASVGIAYIGQKRGLSVLDFRGGESMKYFSGKTAKLEVFKALGATPIEENSAKSNLTNGKRILSKMETGKEYYLSVGRHASIVRLSDEGVPQYLELQSASRFGWHDFNSDVRETLKWRFGCSQSSSYWSSAYLTDIDQFQDNDDFRTLLSYINTNESEQRKGKHGTIK